MNNLVTGTLFSSGFIIFLLSLEFIFRKLKIKAEFTRRIAHITSGLFGILMASTLKPPVFIFFVLIFLGIISFSYLKKFFTSIHNVKRMTYGEIYLPLGIIITFLISGNTSIFITSILIMSFSDSISGFFSSIFKEKRGYLHSLVFLLITFVIILLFYMGQNLLLLFSISLFLTFIERFSNYGTDNLTVPFSASLLLKYLL